MSTWGPSKKQSSKKSASKPSTKRSTNVNASARTSKTTRASSRAGDETEVMPSRRAPKRSAGPGDGTPARGARSRGDRAASELRDAVEGREHEFLGLAMIGGGVLCALAVFLNLAGPLGRGVETLIGWFTGLGRFPCRSC